MDYPSSVPGVGLVDGKFVDEDQSTGQVGSLIPAKWGNDITDEVRNVLIAAGIAPDEGQVNQLAQAIPKLCPGRLLRTTVYTRIAGVQNVSVNGGAPTAAGATTFDKLPDTAFADVELCGGGGGTGGIIATTSGQQGFAAGGAGAAYARGRFDSGLTGVSVTVGAAGAAGITGGNPGGNGGTSSFGALISAAGGNGSPAGVLSTGVSSLAGINGATTVTGANLLRGSGGRGAGWLASGLGFATGGDAGVSGMGFPNSYGSGGIGRYQAPSQGALAGVAGVDGVVIVREYA